jgi:hypothetical protein
MEENEKSVTKQRTTVESKNTNGPFGSLHLAKLEFTS